MSVELIEQNTTWAEIRQRLNELIAAVNLIEQTGSYGTLTGKPSINDVELSGNVTTEDLGLITDTDLSGAVTDAVSAAISDEVSTLKTAIVYKLDADNSHFGTFSKNNNSSESYITIIEGGVPFKIGLDSVLDLAYNYTPTP